MTEKEFKKLVDEANGCLLHKYCSDCDRFKSRRSNCFVYSKILNFKCMVDPAETVRMAQIISEIGKLFEEKDKEILTLKARLRQADEPELYPCATCIEPSSYCISCELRPI